MARGVETDGKDFREKEEETVEAGTNGRGSKAARTHLTAEYAQLDVASDASPRFVPLIAIVRETRRLSPFFSLLPFFSLRFSSCFFFVAYTTLGRHRRS